MTTGDVSLLGAHYGIGEPAITTRGVAYLDVGPTTDGQVTSRPTPDHRIDFDDLMMFATNFRVVSAPPLAAAPTVPRAPRRSRSRRRPWSTRAWR